MRVGADVHARVEQVRELADELASAQEEERKHLARELHDQVGPDLAGLSLTLAALRNELTEDERTRLQGRLDEAQHLIEQATRRVRDLMADLRPPMLDDMGLLAALRWQAQLQASRSGVRILVEGKPLAPRPSARVEINLFRIAQQATLNALQHGRPARICVRIDAEDAVLRLTVVDDGDGFDPAAQPVAGLRGAWGIAGMRQRAEALRGSLQIISSPGHGARIIAEVPR